MRNTVFAIGLSLVAGAYAPSAQHADHAMPATSKTDMMSTESKIQQAMRAAPPEISARATIMDWPEKDGMPMKQLRAGTNGWMCMPSTAGPARAGQEDPMCVDKTFSSLLDAWTTKTTPKVNGVGLGYMLRGDKGASNTDPFSMEQTPTNHWVVSPPHLMVVVPDPQALDAFPSDPSQGGPWVMWKGTPYAHLMVPTAAMPSMKIMTKAMTKTTPAMPAAK
jgi:hypothetical protein